MAKVRKRLKWRVRVCPLEGALVSNRLHMMLQVLLLWLWLLWLLWLLH